MALTHRLAAPHDMSSPSGDSPGRTEEAPVPSPLSRELATVFGAMQEGVTIADVAAAKLLFANEPGAHLAGFDTAEELCRASPDELSARVQFLDAQGAVIPYAELPHRRAYLGERPPPLEVRARMVRTGEEHVGLLTAIPLLDAQGAVRQVVTIFRHLTQQRRAENALRFLAQASNVLSASLDYHATLQSLVSLVVPQLADGCCVDVLEDGRPYRLHAHADPARDEVMAEIARRYPLRLDTPDGPSVVLRDNTPRIFRDLSPERLRRTLRDEGHLRLFLRMGYRELLAVPLFARGRSLGVLSLATTGSRRFDEADLSLAAELGSRAALAVDNARLYREAQLALRRKDEEVHTSETLRRIGNSLASEMDPARLVQRLTDEATAATGARFGAFFHDLVEPAAGARPGCATSGGPAELFAAVAPRTADVPWRLLEGTRALRSDDVTVDPRFPGARSERAGAPALRSLLAVPVTSRSGEIAGALLFGHPDRAAFTPRHEQLARDIAALAATALENARLFQQVVRAEARSRESEDRLRLALEAGRMGHFDWDWKQRRGFASPRLKELFGRAEGEPFDVEPLGAQLPSPQADESVSTIHVTRQDGEARILESNLRVFRDARGKPERTVGVVMDVTARQRAEADARKLAREEAARAEAEASERRITAILDSIAEPLVAVDHGARCRFVNRAAEALLDAQREELIGHPLEVLTCRGPRLELYEHCARALRERSTHFEARVGRDQWLEVRAGPYDGGVSISLRDITARRRQQDAEQRRARYDALRADVSTALASREEPATVYKRCAEAIVRHLRVQMAGVYTVDSTGRFLERQASAGLFLGGDGKFDRWPADRGSPLGSLLPQGQATLVNDLGSVRDADTLAWIRQNGFVSYAVFPLHVDAQLVGLIALFSAEPMLDEMRAHLSAITDVVAQGIERKRAELALSARAAELARTNSELQQFAYVASHDLQEPLRMVASYTQLLARRYKGRLDKDADEFIHYAVDGVNRMKRMIGDLLAYSRVGTRGQPLAPTRCDDVLAHALEEMDETLLEAGAELSAAPLPEVLADRVQLQELFQHLIGNALKFRGGQAARIRISATRRGDEYLFAVEDNGIGIEPQYFDRIFAIFQRLHGKEEYPGTGIGLAICKKIIDRHGGRIWVESRAGAGSTFYFTLPAVTGSAASPSAPAA